MILHAWCTCRFAGKPLPIASTDGTRASRNRDNGNEKECGGSKHSKRNFIRLKVMVHICNTRTHMLPTRKHACTHGLYELTSENIRTLFTTYFVGHRLIIIIVDDTDLSLQWYSTTFIVLEVAVIHPFETFIER